MKLSDAIRSLRPADGFRPPRRSTIVLCAVFLGTLVLYLAVRPDPPPPTELVPAARVPVTTQPEPGDDPDEPGGPVDPEGPGDEPGEVTTTVPSDATTTTRPGSPTTTTTTAPGDTTTTTAGPEGRSPAPNPPQDTTTTTAPGFDGAAGPPDDGQ